jgi:hypothetical protein
VSELSQLHYLHLLPGQSLPETPKPEPSPVVVIVEAEVAADWQNAVSDWIIAYGCRYMMAWGRDCASWDDSVDWAYLDSVDFSDSNEGLVMTTWHERDTLEDLFHYCEFNAVLSNDDLELNRILILHIADTPDEARLLAARDAMLKGNFTTSEADV